MRTDLGLDKLKMALHRRAPGADVELIYHFDLFVPEFTGRTLEGQATTSRQNEFWRKGWVWVCASTWSGWVDGDAAEASLFL